MSDFNNEFDCDLDKPLHISMLLDTYGSMLTERQADAIDLHYNEDLSLAEIGELYKISRQGVRSTIFKGVNTLQECEERLSIIKNEKIRNKSLKEVLSFLENGKVDEAISMINKMIIDEE